jgi:eukaryotic-like serine/threonine-protein kinase
VLLVLFLLLTVAAVVVGVFVVRSLGGGAQQVDQPPQSASAGTVASREGLLAGPAVPEAPSAVMIDTGATR